MKLLMCHIDLQLITICGKLELLAEETCGA